MSTKPQPQCAFCETLGQFPMTPTKAHGDLPLCPKCVAVCQQHGWAA
jgi:hypothetical protein